MASNMPHRDEVVEGHRLAVTTAERARVFALHFASGPRRRKAEAMLRELPVLVEGSY